MCAEQTNQRSAAGLFKGESWFPCLTQNILQIFSFSVQSVSAGSCFIFFTSTQKPATMDLCWDVLSFNNVSHCFVLFRLAGSFTVSCAVKQRPRVVVKRHCSKGLQREYNAPWSVSSQSLSMHNIGRQLATPLKEFHYEPSSHPLVAFVCFFFEAMSYWRYL